MKILIIIVFIIFSHLSANSQQWSIADSAFGIVGCIYKDIDCADSNNCIAVTKYNLDRVRDRITSDGGKTWTTTLYDSVISWDDRNSPWHDVKYVSYPDTNLCIISCGLTYYWLSRNRGKDWSLHNIDTSEHIFYMKFQNAKNGVVSTYYNIYITNDSARTWKKISRKKSEEMYIWGNSIFFPDSNLIYMCSSRMLHRTSDWGETWDSVPVPCYFSEMYFFNKNEGFGVGCPKVNTNIYKDMLYFTSNGGETWEKRIDSIVPYPSNPAGLTQIEFSDRYNGIAIGPWYKMYITNDGGLTWWQDLSNWKNNTNKGGFMRDISDFTFRTRDEILGTNFTLNKIYRMKLLYTDIKEQQYENNEFYLYPNPTTDNIRIDFNSNIDFRTKIEIFNLLGIKQKEIEYELISGENSITFNVSDLTSGVYFVVVNDGKEVRKQMFIKE